VFFGATLQRKRPVRVILFDAGAGVAIAAVLLRFPRMRICFPAISLGAATSTWAIGRLALSAIPTPPSAFGVAIDAAHATNSQA
jgi:hypothetical protein